MQTLFEIYLTNVRRNFEIPLALDVISSGFAGGPHHSQLNDRLMSRPNFATMYFVFGVGICILYFVCVFGIWIGRRSPSQMTE